MSIAELPRPGVARWARPSSPEPVHPLGTRAKVLLSSVFGPYARDDEYGSRAINPMELWHNQVTRVQGPFSLRMLHRSWGLMLIQANIGARCRCLDFPSLGRFVEEVRTHRYDVIGIGAIIPNVLKVRKMCELIREHSPGSQIVIGGHVANIPGLAERIQADHIVRGDGVRWFREYLGQPTDASIRHPLIPSGFGHRAMGIQLRCDPRRVAAALIPSVGCPIGCNFCATSAMFGGKGKFVHFYETGDELFDVMCQIEAEMHVNSFFVMDENFLLHRRRALRLLELMEQRGKPWALYVFSSANALRSYTMAQLVSLGISWVWLGLEGENSRYGKLKGTDTRALVRELQSHGIRVQGSTIIGLEEHRPENIDQVIDYAVSHDTDFHQFMLYTPSPGTPLHEELKARGQLLGPDEITEADAHGQLRFAHRHPHIRDGQETEYLLRAFRRDFETNGPSILRAARTTLAGWERYHDHPSPHIRKRFAWELMEINLSMLASLWAGRRWFRSNRCVHDRLHRLLEAAHRKLGWTARLVAPLVGQVVYWLARLEQRRLLRGWTIEPPTFYETNTVADQASAGEGPSPSLLRYVVPGAAGAHEHVHSREAIATR